MGFGVVMLVGSGTVVVLGMIVSGIGVDMQRRNLAASRDQEQGEDARYSPTHNPSV